MWKRGYDDDVANWPIGMACWDGPKGEEYDYCGKYKTWDAFSRALEAERGR